MMPWDDTLNPGPVWPGVPTHAVRVSSRWLPSVWTANPSVIKGVRFMDASCGRC
jgi:hypothetical protein